MKPLFRRRRSEAGISLVETLVAVGVTVAGIAGLSSSAQQATVIARSGKAFAAGSQMLQERIERFRQVTNWSNVTTASGIAALTASSSAVASTFPNVTETFTVQPYPSGTALVVTRSPSGTFSNNGATLPTTTLVKLTITATWTAAGNVQNSRQLSTIIAKGGL
jgi:hypothetical protein